MTHARGYVALPPGASRAGVLLRPGEAGGTLAWGQLGRDDDAPGLLVQRGGWAPAALYALTAAAGGFGALAMYDGATEEHGFAAAWGGVRLEERHGVLDGGGEADLHELDAFFEAVSGLSRVLLRPSAGAEIAGSPPPLPARRELARIVAAEASPVPGWQRFPGDGYVLLEREGPEDPGLTRGLGGSSLWCADGGAVRWIHGGEAGEGHGWRDAVAAWERFAAPLGLTPAELAPFAG